MDNELVLIVNAKSNVLKQREEYIKYFKNKFKMTIISPEADSLKKKPYFKNIKFKNLPISRSGTSFFTELKTVLSLYKSIREIGKNAIFHAYTIKPIFYLALINKIAFRGKLNTYSTFTGLGYLFINQSKDKLLRFTICKLLKFCFKNANQRIIFQNPDDRKLFIKLNIVNQGSQIVLGSGVDTHYFDFNPKPKGSPLKLLFIGRLLTDKGLLELLKAFSNFSKREIIKTELIIAGDTDYDNPKSIDDATFNSFLCENIKYVGYQNDIKSIIIDSDAVILPSYREGVPLSLIQALSIGRPIITSDAPGCKETVIDRKNGYMVKVKSVESIESALVFLTKQSDKNWLSLGKESRKLAENVFSSNIVNLKIEHLYRQDLKL